MGKGITGDEPIDLRMPEGALAEYYRAFNSHDLKLMRQNWDATEDASLYHPLGGLRRGWEEIGAIYELIFSGPAGVMVEFQDFAIHRFGDCFLAVGIERGVLRTLKEVLDFRVRTSRTYAWRAGRWKQIHHHGSIEEPELLSCYQSMVLTGHLHAS